MDRSIADRSDRLPMPPTDDRRASDICVWLITAIFILSIVGGGSLLIVYIALPASKSTSWFPIAGMVLIAIPWTFWILTCIYRTVIGIYSPETPNNPTIRAAAVAPANANTASNGGSDGVASPVGSPGGARRVRFGNATVLGSTEGTGSGTPRGQAGGEGDGVSPTSSEHRESERPLTLSMH